MKAIYNLFHCTADNIGDQMCGPAQYFWPTNTINVPFNMDFPISADRIIIGGGQVFGQLAAAGEIINIHQKNAKLVAWGVGISPLGLHDDTTLAAVANFRMFGTRNYDWREHLSFTPCASCMSPLFDRIAPPKHEVVAFLHGKKTPSITLPDDVPIMTNGMRPPAEVIEFISSGETVLTSSYHGVYWAQLMGRKVVCIPYSKKFNSFQHPPTFSTADKWHSALPTARKVEPLLEEYRSINKAFATDVEAMWDAD